MKRCITAFSIFLTITIFAVCTVSCSADIHDEAVIPDSVLETEIRQVLGKENGPILISDLQSITELTVSGGAVNLDGLQHCRNLISLNINGNRITDLSPVSDLVKLKILLMRSNPVSDISAVSSLTGLYYLDIRNCGIPRIPDLSKLNNLEFLIIDQNDIADISPLVVLNNLKKLSCRDSSLTDISALQTMISLEQLDLSGNEITDISPLESLVNLRILTLGANCITDVSPLSKLGQLEILSLTDNEIEDLTPLDTASFKNLTALFLEENRITYLPPFTALPKLATLGILEGNPLSPESLETIDQMSDRGMTILRSTPPEPDGPASE